SGSISAFRRAACSAGLCWRRRPACLPARSPANTLAPRVTSDSVWASAPTSWSAAPGARSHYNRARWGGRVPATAPWAAPRSNCGQCLEAAAAPKEEKEHHPRANAAYQTRARPELRPRKAAARCEEGTQVTLLPFSGAGHLMLVTEPTGAVAGFSRLTVSA